MIRVNRAELEINDKNIRVVFYRHDWDYDDAMNYIEMYKEVDEIVEENLVFALGCYEFVFYKANFQDELTFLEKCIRDAGIDGDEERKNFFEEEKQKLLNAKDVRKLIIEYHQGKLSYYFGGEWRDIEIEDGKGKLLFRNLKIYIEKF